MMSVTGWYKIELLNKQHYNKATVYALWNVPLCMFTSGFLTSGITLKFHKRDATHQIIQHRSPWVHSVNQHPACVPPLPQPPLSPCLSILRGVNSRGVGVGGSTMVHGYRMCLGGYAAWLPSVRIVRCSLTFSLSLSLSAHLLTLSRLLILYLAVFPFFLSRMHGHRCSTSMLSVH